MFQWIEVKGDAQKGVADQWIARVDERSVAAIKPSTCDYPRCDCLVMVFPQVSCQRPPSWIGVLCGPDGEILDIAVEGHGVSIDIVKSEAERGLRGMGWGESSGEKD